MTCPHVESGATATAFRTIAEAALARKRLDDQQRLIDFITSTNGEST